MIKRNCASAIAVIQTIAVVVLFGFYIKTFKQLDEIEIAERLINTVKLEGSQKIEIQDDNIFEEEQLDEDLAKYCPVLEPKICPEIVAKIENKQEDAKIDARIDAQINLKPKENDDFTPEYLSPEFMYQHPEHAHIYGRPFSGLNSKYMKILKSYLNHPATNPNCSTTNWTNLQLPRLVTAISSDHFEEHKLAVQSIIKYWPVQPKIVIYDLGLMKFQKEFFYNNSVYEYREFPFDKYPVHVRWLRAMGWKVVIMLETLQEFGSVFWFDSSIVINQSPMDLLRHHFCRKGSSWLFYINPAVHNIVQ